ncbi:hypothetical protein IQ269_19250 [Tychonema sp. LEGE 07199]|uniref:hypothetical protein n=1 Tax=unclassified Tychonema TaxID=2642144 RepID=UPI00187E6BD0|nr:MULTISPECIES: hypothetical protein [unclassified Tychonema]MBE9122875.1 hypothetical protein [Tychonema sp. LEGE 07199]MBE9134730.1 hypothetical protein [Tychonema sp. LEGE 07196]
MQTLTLISTCLSLFAAVLAIWVANNSGIRRLVLIQKRLDASMGLIVTLQSRVNDLEKFASVNHGYHIRDGKSQIEKFFKDSYGESDTGF